MGFIFQGVYFLNALHLDKIYSKQTKNLHFFLIQCFLVRLFILNFLMS